MKHMASKFATGMALLIAERKIIDASYKFFKHAYEASLQNRYGQLDSLQKEYANRLFNAFVISYFFGSLDAWTKVGKQKKMMFADEVDFEYIKATIFQVIKDNPQILVAFAKRKVSEEEIFQEIFRPPIEALEFLNNYTVKLARVESHELLQTVTKTVQETIQKGLSEADAQKYLKERFTEFKQKRVNAIARTESTRAYNFGLVQRSIDVIKGYRYSAVLDAKTTHICKERHGKFIPADNYTLLAYNTPPLHVNCRSTLIPEFEQTAEIIDMNKLPEPQKRVEDIEDFSEFLRRLR